jgi:hypothetical protein
MLKSEDHTLVIWQMDIWAVAPLTGGRPLWLSAGTEQIALCLPPHQVIHPILGTVKQAAARWIFDGRIKLHPLHGQTVENVFLLPARYIEPVGQLVQPHLVAPRVWKAAISLPPVGELPFNDTTPMQITGLGNGL